MKIFKNIVLLIILLFSTITFAQAKFNHFDGAERQDRKTQKKSRYDVDVYTSLDLDKDILAVTEGDKNQFFFILQESLSKFEFEEIKCFSYDVISLEDDKKRWTYTYCDNGTFFMTDENIRTMYYSRKMLNKK